MSQDTYPAVLESLLAASVLAAEGNVDSDGSKTLDGLGGSSGAVLLVLAIRVAAHLGAGVPVSISPLGDAALGVSEAVGGKGRSDEEAQGGKVDDLHLGCWVVLSEGEGSDG